MGLVWEVIVYYTILYYTVVPSFYLLVSIMIYYFLLRDFLRMCLLDFFLHRLFEFERWNENFVVVICFLSLWFGERERKIYILSVHVVVTLNTPIKQKLRNNLNSNDVFNASFCFASL